MKEKYLPIGTVVTLNGATKRIMIIGYCPMAGDNQVFDYSACTYPEGVISTDKTLAFNHSQINKIDFMGFEDAEQSEFNGKIKDMLKGVEALKQVQLPSDSSKDTSTGEIPVLEVTPSSNVNSIEDIMKSE